MSRPLDLSSLTRAERAVLTFSVLAFVNGSIPWWYRTQGPGGTFLYGAALRPLSLIAVLCAIAALLIALSRAWIWPQPAPERDGLIYTLLGAFSAVAIIAQLIAGTAPWVGIGIGLLLSVGLTTAGVRRRRERAGGWS